MRAFRLSLLLFVLLFTTSVHPVAGQAGTGRLNILFTHDLHSYMLPVAYSENGTQTLQGGFARMAQLIRTQRTRLGEDSTLVLDGGDFSIGTLFQTLFLSEASELRAMGQMGYDALTFGNHEFDFHSDNLAVMLQKARASGERLPLVIASNITFNHKEGDTSPLEQEFAAFPVKDYAVIEKNGLRVGLFGIMGVDAANDVPFAPDVTFDDPVESAKRVVDILQNKEKVDVIICLSHSGTSPDKSLSEDETLARAVPQIDMILSGHSHTVLLQPIIIGKTVIASAGSYGAYLGVLELNLSGGDTPRVAAYNLIPLTPDLPEDEAMAARIEGYKQDVNQAYLAGLGLDYDRKVAESAFDLPLDVYTLDHPRTAAIGQLVSDAYIYAVQQVEGSSYAPISLSLEPIGLVRGPLVQGEISVSEVFEVLSLGLGQDGATGYPLMSLYLTGAELKNAVEVDTTLAALKPDMHLEVSGIRATFNPNRVPLDRVTSLEVLDAAGQYRPVDPQRLYRVVTNYYVVAALDSVGKRSMGLLEILPKDQQGHLITARQDMIIDADPHQPGRQELKEWLVLESYLQSFPDSDGDGLPEIPERYRKVEALIVEKPSWNPVDLLGGATRITWMALGVVLLALALLAGLVLLVVRLVGKLRRRAASTG